MEEGSKRRIEKKESKKSLLFDLCLIAALLILAGIFYIGYRLLAPIGEYVRVTHEGEEILLVPLSVDGTYPLNGGTNTLLVEGGKASVILADCPDKLCEKQRAISRVGERIICLPNRITVEIIGRSDKDEPDLTISSVSESGINFPDLVQNFVPLLRIPVHARVNQNDMGRRDADAFRIRKS